MIVQSTIDLAHNLDMYVVAEGVEDAATLELLKARGCDLVQGYYFSRPMAAQDLFLARRDVRTKVAKVNTLDSYKLK